MTREGWIIVHPSRRAWFGGKSRVAHLVWERLGNPPAYVEPFFGSGAVLFLRPDEPGTETVNDADGFLCNFFRALQADPDAVAHWADSPVSECDLHAWHYRLVQSRDDLTDRLCGDPDYYDAKIAGKWVWGLCCWIGSGWCSGEGPWVVEDGKLVNGNAGRGVNRQLPHLGDAGRGVNRQRPQLSGPGRGIPGGLDYAGHGDLYAYMRSLADRLRRVRVCCGDWTRVMGPSVLFGPGEPCGVFLDPPYSDPDRANGLYGVDDMSVAADVRRWAIEHGDDPRLMIALCGYEGEHDMPATWETVAWSAPGGYAGQGNGNGKENRHRERLYFSPHCLKPERHYQPGLWETLSL